MKLGHTAIVVTLLQIWPYVHAQRECSLGTEACEGADLLLINGTLWTADDQVPYAEALAINRQQGCISRVGIEQEVLALRDSTTQVVDLQGKWVMPGIIDTHVHLLEGGYALQQADLTDIRSPAEFTARLQQACGKEAPGSWVLGNGWDSLDWGGPLPTKDWIPAACEEQYLYLLWKEGHMALINDLAAEKAGITQQTPDPEGGQILKDSEGRLNGLLTELAMNLVKPLIPAPTIEDKLQSLKIATQYLLSQGITTVHDVGPAPTNVEVAWQNLLEVYLKAAEAGDLGIRVAAMVPLFSWERLKQYISSHGRSHISQRVFWGSLKEFADGTVGARTALMHKPYPNDPSTNGIATIDYEALAEAAAGANEACLQVAIHAIGDKAIDSTLDAYAHAQQHQPQDCEPLPHRIEHAEHFSGPRTIAHFKELGVRAMGNPIHITYDRENIERELGPSRSAPGATYAYKSLLEGGGKLAFGSDWPVVKPQALYGAYVSVHRRAPGERSEQAFFPSEGLDAETAIRLNTIKAARLMGLDKLVGSLRRGKRADLAVLSGSPLLSDSESPIPKVVSTFVDGVCAFGCADYADAVQSVSAC